MYRDDLEGALQRAGALERELGTARSEGHSDRARLQYIERELIAARQAIAAMRRGQPMMFPPTVYQGSSATTVLVLGILSIVVCSLLGPLAWHFGNQELRRIQEGLVDPGTQGTVTAGRVLGIISTVLMLVGLGVVLFALAIAA